MKKKMKKASIPMIVVASLVLIGLAVIAGLYGVMDSLEMIQSPRTGDMLTPYPNIKLSEDGCTATVDYDALMELGGNTPNVLYYRNQNSWSLGSNATSPYHHWDYDWTQKYCIVRYVSLNKPYNEDLVCNGTVYSTQFNGYRTYALEGGTVRISPPSIGGTGHFNVAWEGKLKKSVRPECYSGDVILPPPQSFWEKAWGWILWVLGL